MAALPAENDLTSRANQRHLAGIPTSMEGRTRRTGERARYEPSAPCSLLYVRERAIDAVGTDRLPRRVDLWQEP